MKSDTDTRCSRHTALLPYICEPRFCPLYPSCSGDLTFQSTNLPNDHSISQFRRNCYFFRLNFVFLFIFVNITILAYRLRILHPFRHGIPFVKANTLLEFRLFKRKLREIILQIIHQLTDAFPGLVIYHKDPLTAHVLHPLSDHGNVGMGRIHLGDDPDQRP